MTYLDILIKIRQIIRSVNLESKKIEKKFGISIPQLLCLQFLTQQPEYKASATAIKEFINLNASTVSGIIKRLETKGLVAKVPHPEDRRITQIILTAQGAELIDSTPTTLQEKLTRRLERLPPEQIKDLCENIDLLITLMDAEDVDAAPVVTNKEFNPPPK